MNPVFVIGFAFAMAMVGVFSALALSGGLAPVAIVAVRSVGVALILAVYLGFARIPLRLPARDLARVVAIGLVMSVNNFSLTSAISRIPVPLATMLFYVWPALVALGSARLGHERVSGRTLFAIACSFAGISLALQVRFDAAEWLGVALALTGALAWSSCVLAMRQFLPRRDARIYTFWVVATSACVMVLASALTGQPVLPSGLRGWVGLIGLPLWYSVGIIGFYVASASLGATRTSLYMNSEPIASVLLSALILGQSLAPVQMIGAALVIGALFLYRPAR